jgi:hypothetical protein
MTVYKKAFMVSQKTAQSATNPVDRAALRAAFWMLEARERRRIRVFARYRNESIDRTLAKLVVSGLKRMRGSAA